MNINFGSKKQDGVEEMVKCPQCKVYFPRGNQKNCGKTNCPY
jgi:uncharacterized C2H2 Zn-finger protein